MENHIHKIMFIVILFSLMNLMVSCSTSLVYRENGNVNDAAYNAVIDFAHNHTRLLKKHSVFRVINFGEENPESNFYRLIIIGNDRPFLFNKSKSQNENKFPTNYLEVENKLFIWYDDAKQIDSSTIETYKKYNLLVDDENGKIKYLDNDAIDEEQKGVIYFFCQKNLTTFEKKVANKSIKFPKRLSCPQN